MEISERVDVTVSEEDRRVTVNLSGRTGQIAAGGNGLNGYLFLRSDDGEERVRLDGRAGSLYVGGHGSDGRVFISKTVTEGGRPVDHISIHLDGRQSNIRAGGNGSDGDVLLFAANVSDISRNDEASIWLDSGTGNVAIGGNARDGDLLMFPSAATISTSDPAQATIWLDSGNGNIRAGGHGTDGDLLLYPPGVEDIRQDTQASIWLDSGRANMAIGGNGRDGDVLLYPRAATIATDETAHTTIWLNGENGNIQLQGGLMPKGGPAHDRHVPGYSTDEGYVAAFEGSVRHGYVEFTHDRPDERGDREKLRNIHVYHPLLHANSIVWATSHAGGPCVATVSYLPSPDVTDHSGYFIDLHMVHKLSPGREVRVVYWIMN